MRIKFLRKWTVNASSSVAPAPMPTTCNTETGIEMQTKPDEKVDAKRSGIFLQFAQAAVRLINRFRTRGRKKQDKKNNTNKPVVPNVPKYAPKTPLVHNNNNNNNNNNSNNESIISATTSSEEDYDSENAKRIKDTRSMGSRSQESSSKVKDRLNFHSWYKILKPASEGSFSRVHLAIHRVTGEIVAVKKIDKRMVLDDLERSYLELQCLQKMDHPNVCKMFQSFDTGKYLLIVVERCIGDLFDIIHKEGRVRERVAKNIFRQIVVGLEHIHRQGFAHRDVKPENVMFDQHGNVKLIDFNLSARVWRVRGGGVVGGSKWNLLSTHCGTIEYAAPELISRPDEKYEGPPVDMWALGVVLYVMLTGTFPFLEPGRTAKIMISSYEVPRYLSRESRHLLGSLLQVVPKSRLTAGQVIQHPWITLKKWKKGRPLTPVYQVEIGDMSPYVGRNYVITKPLDLEILHLMSSELKINVYSLRPILEDCRRNSNSTSFEIGMYNILLRKKESVGLEHFREWKLIWKRERYHLADLMQNVEIPQTRKIKKKKRKTISNY